MIISVPSSLKRSHSSRLSKVAVTPSRSCRNSGETVGLGSLARLIPSLLLCRHKDLSLFVSVLSRMVSWSDAGLFLFASTSVAEKNHKSLLKGRCKLFFFDPAYSDSKMNIYLPFLRSQERIFLEEVDDYLMQRLPFFSCRHLVTAKANPGMSRTNQFQP